MRCSISVSSTGRLSFSPEPQASPSAEWNGRCALTNTPLERFILRPLRLSCMSSIFSRHSSDTSSTPKSPRTSCGSLASLPHNSPKWMRIRSRTGVPRNLASDWMRQLVKLRRNVRMRQMQTEPCSPLKRERQTDMNDIRVKLKWSAIIELVWYVYLLNHFSVANISTLVNTFGKNFRNHTIDMTYCPITLRNWSQETGIKVTMKLTCHYQLRTIFS